MKKCVLLLFTVAFCLTASLPANSNPRKIIRIDMKGVSPAAREMFFQLGVDVLSQNQNQMQVRALVTADEIGQIEKLNLKTETLIPDADAFARQLRQTGYLDHFQTYEEIVGQMQEIVNQHPDIARLEDIGDSYEKTVNRGGHDIFALKISDHVHLEEDEPEVFFMSNIHAREIITPAIILNIMHYLVDRYAEDPEVTYLVDQRQIWLVPSANPDGYEYVLSGSNPLNSYQDPIWWRKNKRDNYENGRFDPGSDGVDLNRNFGYHWGGIGSSSQPSEETYRGKTPFSEPESQAIRNFVNRHQFLISVSFHSYGQYWLYPWGYQRAYTPDHLIFVALADSCVAYNRYQPGTGPDILYATSGDTDDWFYGEQEEKNKIYAFTPEVGSELESLGEYTGFFPDTSFIQKQILENLKPALYLTYAVGQEPLIQAEVYSNTEDTRGPYRLIARMSKPIPLTQTDELDGDSFKMYYRAAGMASFDSVRLMPTGEIDEYDGEIPALGDDITIEYYFKATDMSGRTGHAPRYAPRTVYSFFVRPDTIPPVILHTPVRDQSLFPPEIKIHAVATDDSEIEKVLLLYRLNSDPLDSLEMSATGAAGEFEVRIRTDSLAISDRIEYRIKAVDHSRNANTSYLPENGFYRFRILGGFFIDFETEDGGLTPGAGSDWEWGMPTSGPASAHSGSLVWATKVAGDYRNSSDSWLDTQPVNLAGMIHVSFSFWHWYSTEASQGVLWDGGNVKISMDGGAFSVLQPSGGYDGIIDPYNPFLADESAFGGYTGSGDFWHEEFFDLTPFVNHQVVIRFHFGSDDNTPAPGWYIDDLEFLFNPIQAPVIVQTNQLPNTMDVTGPYVVSSTITDNTGLSSVSVNYSLDQGLNFTEIPMVAAEGDLYRAGIPGQAYGTIVEYYVRARDEDGAVTTDPEDISRMTYRFIVTDRAPQLFVKPTELNVLLIDELLFQDSLLIANSGLIDLHFDIRDSLISGTTQPLSIVDSPKLKKGNSLPWLFIHPVQGRLHGEDSTFIHVVIDASALLPGQYLAWLIIASNDPLSPQSVVPVNVSIMKKTDTSATDPQPESFSVSQNYPNPFNAQTSIGYQLPVTSQVVLKIYNIMGHEIAILADGAQPAGEHRITWDGKDQLNHQVPNGVYLCSFKAGEFVRNFKMILLQ